MKTQHTISIAILIGGVIIAGAVYTNTSTKSSVFNSNNKDNTSLVRPLSADDHILGNPTASVLIIEYSDFDCEYCKIFHSTLHRVISDFGSSGDVAWVFRHFPITEKHENARKHALASECVASVAGNDAFWAFTDALFENQPTDPKNHGAFAQAIGANPSLFAECMQNAQSIFGDGIDADRTNGISIGANGAPYTLIIANGQAPAVISGVYTYEDVKTIVQTLLYKIK